MQFKPVPDPPANLEGVEPILEAVPETAGAVEDCCAHLCEETRLERREAAETWLVFLRALEVVTAEPAGFRRRMTDSPDAPELDPTALGQSFRERVYGADSIVGIVEQSDESPSAVEVSDRLRAEGDDTRGPRAARFETDMCERIRRVLEWAVVLDLAERRASGPDGPGYDAPADPDESQ